MAQGVRALKHGNAASSLGIRHGCGVRESQTKVGAHHDTVGAGDPSTAKLKLIMADLGYVQPGATSSECDSSAAMLNAASHRQSPRSKHFQLTTQFLREWTRLGYLHLRQIPTKDNLADMFTKPLSPSDFGRLAMRIMDSSEAETGDDSS